MLFLSGPDVSTGTVTEVLDRDRDFQITYTNDTSGGTFCINKNQAVNLDLIANAVGKSVKVYETIIDGVVAVSIDHQAALEKAPYKLSESVAVRPLLTRLFSNTVPLAL